MADQAYENAMRKREDAIARVRAAESDLGNARAELERVDAFIQQWHEFAGTPILDRDPVVVHYPKRRNPKKEEVADLAYEIIKEHGEPMSRSELYEKLQERGMVLNGNDPEMVLSTMLWRSQAKIRRLPKYGYWMTDTPYVSAGYTPGQPIAVDDEEQAMLAADSEQLLPEHQ
jgi:hypothetical protein